MKDNVIITASDEKYSNFVLNHWLKSLIANVNLDNTDIAILDYGLNKKQRDDLKKIKHVRTIRCRRDGRVATLRYRDMLSFLQKNHYKQVMSCDGGDIIFQKDISHLFNESKDSYRAVYEDEPLPLHEFFISLLDKSIRKDFEKYTKNKKIINSGVLVAPRAKFMRVCQYCDDYIADKKKFGPDQLIVNYVLYKEGFKILDRTYNYVLYTAKSSFKVKNGKFFDNNGNLIAIVHNSGNKDSVRAIKDFGYGDTLNKKIIFGFHFLKSIIRLSNLIFMGRLSKKLHHIFARR